MATVCCSTLSLTEIIGMFSLGNHELRLYRTCKVIFETHQVRHDWWRHLQRADSLAWHLDPCKAQCSWDSFFAWREYVLGDPLPVAIPSLHPMSDEEDDGGNAVANRVPTAILEDYPESDEDSMSRYSYSSCPDYPPVESSESDFSEDDITVVGSGNGPHPCRHVRDAGYCHPPCIVLSAAILFATGALKVKQIMFYRGAGDCCSARTVSLVTLGSRVTLWTSSWEMACTSTVHAVDATPIGFCMDGCVMTITESLT